jgi:hypothetical protein
MEATEIRMMLGKKMYGSIHKSPGVEINFLLNALAEKETALTSVNTLNQHLYDVIAAEQDRVKELEGWKEEALLVEREWNPQVIGNLLGMLPGSSIRKEIEPKIRLLLQDNAALRAEVERLRGVCKAVLRE